MNCFTRLVLCFLTLSQKHVNVYAHRVTSLLTYAQNICERALAPPMLNATLAHQLTGEQIKCEYEYLGIITAEGNLADVDTMAFTLGYIFGESSYEVGAKLAARIHDKCGEDLLVANDRPTSKWHPFFTCVSKILKVEKKLVMTARSGDPIRDEIERLKNLQLPEDEINQIYPRLCCHPSYNSDTSNHQRGEGKLIFSYKFCKYGLYHEPDCVDRCMAEQIGIIDIDPKSFKRAVWSSKATMIDRFRAFLINGDYKAATELANKIIDKCYEKVLKRPALRVNCKTVTWKNFFDCVNPIIDCAQRAQAEK